jgi:hypothetical protein
LRAPELIFSNIKKSPTRVESELSEKIKTLRNLEMFVGFQNEISNESGPPNMAGATIIAAARARDSTS